MRGVGPRQDAGEPAHAEHRQQADKRVRGRFCRHDGGRRRLELRVEDAPPLHRRRQQAQWQRCRVRPCHRSRWDRHASMRDEHMMIGVKRDLEHVVERLGTEVDDRRVKLIRVESPLRLARGQCGDRDTDRGMPQPQRLQDRADRRHRSGDDPHPQLAAQRPRILRGMPHRTECSDQLLCDRQDPLPLRCQADEAAIANDEPPPEQLLQRDDTGRQRRLADAALLRGPREVLLMGQRTQIFHRAQLHYPSPTRGPAGAADSADATSRIDALAANSAFRRNTIAINTDVPELVATNLASQRPPVPNPITPNAARHWCKPTGAHSSARPACAGVRAMPSGLFVGEAIRTNLVAVRVADIGGIGRRREASRTRRAFVGAAMRQRPGMKITHRGAGRR